MADVTHNWLFNIAVDNTKAVANLKAVIDQVKWLQANANIVLRVSYTQTGTPPAGPAGAPTGGVPPMPPSSVAELTRVTETLARRNTEYYQRANAEAWRRTTGGVGATPFFRTGPAGTWLNPATGKYEPTPERIRKANEEFLASQGLAGGFTKPPAPKPEAGPARPFVPPTSEEVRYEEAIDWYRNRITGRFASAARVATEEARRGMAGAPPIQPPPPLPPSGGMPPGVGVPPGGGIPPPVAIPPARALMLPPTAQQQWWAYQQMYQGYAGARAAAGGGPPSTGGVGGGLGDIGGQAASAATSTIRNLRSVISGLGQDWRQFFQNFQTGQNWMLRSFLLYHIIIRSLGEVAQQIAKVVTLNIQLEATAARLGFTMNASAAAADNQARAIQSIAAAYGQLPSTLGEGTIRIAQFTKNMQEQKSVAEAAAKLSVMTGESFEKSAEGLARIMRAAGIETKNVNSLLDILASLMQEVPLPAAELLNILEALGPLVNQLGIPLDKLAIVTARTAQAAGAQEAQIANFIGRIATLLEQPRVQQVLAGKGIIVHRYGVDELRPLVEILNEMAAAFDKMSEAERKAFVADVFGGRGQLFKIAMAFMSEYNSATVNAVSHTELLARAMDTTAFKIQEMTAAWELLLQALGETAPIRNAVDALTKAFKGWLAPKEILETYGAKAASEAVIRAEKAGRINPIQAQLMLGQLALWNMLGAAKQPMGAEEVRAARWAGMGGVMPLVPSPPGGGVGGGPVGTREQQLFYEGGPFAKLPMLQPINEISISEQQLKTAIDEANRLFDVRLELWRQQLILARLTGEQLEKNLQTLRDEKETAISMVMVENQPRFVRGVPDLEMAARKLGTFDQMRFMRIGQDVSPERLQERADYYKRVLESYGLFEKSNDLLVGLGKDELKAMAKLHVSSTAIQLAVEESARLDKARITGLYNFPAGADAKVMAFDAYNIDRYTRSLMRGQGATAGLPGGAGLPVGLPAGLPVGLPGAGLPVPSGRGAEWAGEGEVSRRREGAWVTQPLGYSYQQQMQQAPNISFTVPITSSVTLTIDGQQLANITLKHIGNDLNAAIRGAGGGGESGGLLVP